MIGIGGVAAHQFRPAFEEVAHADLVVDLVPLETRLEDIGRIRAIRKRDPLSIGAEKILGQINKSVPVTRRRVGITGLKAPARDHAEILSADGEKIGEVTSGTFSPSLGKPLAMGYVKAGFNKAGTEVQVVVRGKAGPGVITKMPFVECQYYKP